MSLAPTSDVFLKLPKTLKVGAYDWTIVLEDGDSDLYGQADFENRYLRIWHTNMTSGHHLVGIILHECLHVIFDNEKLEKLRKDKEEREEQIVLAYESGLVSLFRDNPKFVTWMQKWLR